jgi:pyridinium-3,5-bisthiocarboxylic acid mononucleotide nickel chelatase
MSVLKIEAFSGMSGDMFLGSLAQLTDAWDELVDLPMKLGLEKVEVRISDINKRGIACKHIKIVDHNVYNNFILNPSKAVHHHRHLNDINKIIDDATIPGETKQIAKDIFLLLGEAESKVHGVDINKIHFHEVGAIDSILDIVGTAYLLAKLNIQKVYATDIRTGKGFVNTEHGLLPIPCPATKELLIGFPTYAGEIDGEMTTPTGAAILKYLNPEFNIPSLIEEKTGYGPGEKNFQHPNVLRLSLCKMSSATQENIYIIETNIDDMSSEIIGLDFQEQLFEQGALDFYFTQVLMKKGRPGLMISVMANEKDIDAIADYLLENTTSIGIRYYSVSRRIAPREIKEVKTTLGLISVKEIILPSGEKRLTPEYESCLAIAREKKIPVKQILSKVISELKSLSEC